MQVISFMDGTIWVHSSWEEVRPMNGVPLTLVLEALQTHYKFSMAGFSPLAQQVGLYTPSLQLGSMQKNGESYGINSLDFSPTFFSIGASRTDISEKIMADVFDFLSKNFHFRAPPNERERSYRSTIILDPSGLDLGTTMGGWNQVLDILNAKLRDKSISYKPLGVRFVKDGPVVAGAPDTPFTFERRLASPPGTNWWFSQAPVDTGTHVAILEAIEKLFQG